MVFCILELYRTAHRPLEKNLLLHFCSEKVQFPIHQFHPMLRLVSYSSNRTVPRLFRAVRLLLASYHVLKWNKAQNITYDTLTNYGSYKANAITHRLPESTAQQSPPLVALHNRLRLPESYSMSTLSQALNSESTSGLADNHGLSILGKNLLAYYVSEHLLMTYPRLPLPVHNEATNAYMGSYSLIEIGRSWGIEVDEKTKLQKTLSNEPDFLTYGKLRFLSDAAKDAPKEEGIEELSESDEELFDSHTKTFLTKEEKAYVKAVRAVIGGMYTHAGEEAAKKFIQSHILSRKIPLHEMFQFSRPTRELTRLCDKLNLEDPLEIRLIAETGRLSTHAIYVAGAFSGGHKLGEGVGASLNEAKTRAVVNALLSYYLYTPVNEQGEEIKNPSDESYKFEGIVGLGDVAI